MKSTIVLIDGGFLRSQANQAGKSYKPPFIEAAVLKLQGGYLALIARRWLKWERR